MNRTKIITVTTQEYLEDTLIYKSYYHCHDDSTEVLDIHHKKNVDGDSLAVIYNDAINNNNIKNHDYLIFCHDDLSLEDAQLLNKLDAAIGEDSEFAICGLAGNAKCNIQDKNLWHLMGDRKSMSGAVAHYTGKDDTECFMTPFGATPKRVLLLDGVFIAINLKKIKEAGLRFDEDNPSEFHFYDLDFCLQANKLGLKMTTVPIWAVHTSHGLSDINNKKWVEGNKYFKNKWGN